MMHGQKNIKLCSCCWLLLLFLCITNFPSRTNRLQYKMFVRTVPLDRKCRTELKRVQMDKKMKILNDKMSQQSRRALPPPHSFFCSSTCSSWQLLRTAPHSLWFMNNWLLPPQFTAPLVSALLTIYYDSHLYFFFSSFLLMPLLCYFLSFYSRFQNLFLRCYSHSLFQYICTFSFLPLFHSLPSRFCLPFIYLFRPFLFFVHCTRPFSHILHSPFFTSCLLFVALPSQSLFIFLFLSFLPSFHSLHSLFYFSFALSFIIFIRPSSHLLSFLLPSLPSLYSSSSSSLSYLHSIPFILFFIFLSPFLS